MGYRMRSAQILFYAGEAGAYKKCRAAHKLKRIPHALLEMIRKKAVTKCESILSQPIFVYVAPFQSCGRNIIGFTARPLMRTS